MSLSSMYIYTFIIYPPGFLRSGWAGKNTRQILNNKTLVQILVINIVFGVLIEDVLRRDDGAE